MKRDDAYDLRLRREHLAGAAYSYFLRQEFNLIDSTPREKKLSRAAVRAIEAADVLLAELCRAEKASAP
jgi:hypothetical protein